MPVVLPAGLAPSVRSAPVVAIIPARFTSTRLPGKPLALIAGRPMIEHVYRARQPRPRRSTPCSWRPTTTASPTAVDRVRRHGGDDASDPPDRHGPPGRSRRALVRRHHRQRPGRRAAHGSGGHRRGRQPASPASRRSDRHAATRTDGRRGFAQPRGRQGRRRSRRRTRCISPRAPIPFTRPGHARARGLAALRAVRLSAGRSS